MNLVGQTTNLPKHCAWENGKRKSLLTSKWQDPQFMKAYHKEKYARLKEKYHQRWINRDVEAHRKLCRGAFVVVVISV